MRTAIILEENNVQYRTIIDMFVKKGEINNCIEIHFTFDEENVLSSLGTTFFVDYAQESKLRNIQSEYKLSDEKIISFVFNRTMNYVHKCIRENSIIDIYSFIDSIIGSLSFKCKRGIEL